MIFKGEEGYYWKVLTPDMTANPKATNNSYRQHRRLSNTENEIKSPQNSYFDDSVPNPEQANNHRELAVPHTENDAQLQSYQNYFLNNRPDRPLFNKSQKRISRLTNQTDILPCTNTKSDVLDRIFQEFDKPIAMGQENVVKPIQYNNPSCKKNSAKINPWMHTKKSTNFTKIKADTVNIKRNIKRVMGQRAHMNGPLCIEKPKEVKNAVRPVNSKASTTSNVAQKKTFKLKDYKIPKKTVVNRMSSEEIEKLKLNKQISKQNVKAQESTRQQLQSHDRSESSRRQSQSHNKISESRRRQSQSHDKISESNKQQSLSNEKAFEFNRQESQTCNKILESNRQAREVKLKKQRLDESVKTSESSKHKSEGKTPNNGGSEKNTTTKFNGRRIDKIKSKSTKQNNEKRKLKNDKSYEKKNLKEISDGVNSQLQSKSVNCKNTAKSNKKDKASSPESSISPPESPIPQLELPKAVDRKQIFKRISIQDDEEEEEDDEDFNVKPPSKKVRPLDSDSEESETEEVSLPSLSNISQGNESANFVAEVLEGPANSMEVDSDETVNFDDTVNSFEDDFENAVNFEDGESFNDCGIRIENVESGVDVIYSEENLQAVPEHSSEIAGVQSYDQTNFSENSIFARNSCEREDSIVIDDDDDDDEIMIIDEIIKNPVNKLPTESTAPNSNQPVSELPTHSSTYNSDSRMGSVEDLFRKPMAIAKTNEIAKLLKDYMCSDNRERLERELLRKISSQSSAACCLCKSSTSIEICIRCDQPVCRNFCNTIHPCSGR